jgi:acetyl esterase/lipase
MASEQAEAIKALLRTTTASLVAGTPHSVEQMRAEGELFGELTAEPEGVKWVEDDAGGRPALWAEPEGADRDRVVQYVHGGGYVIGSLASYRKLTGHLARAVGCRVVSVDYRLAPEHPFPAAVTDSVAAYRWLLDQGHRPDQIAVSGDSAGGGLTLATLLALRDQAIPQPAGAVPISPWADLEGTGDSMRTNAGTDLVVSLAGLQGMARMYVPTGDQRDPLAAPLHGDYAGICPLYIQVGADETLLDDARRVAERARAAGVDVTLDIYPEMQHVFQLAAGNMPEADAAVADAGRWLRARLQLA